MRSLKPVSKLSGFTLIEVLVTLVVLLFGLLGIAGLMAKGQQSSFEAYQRQQALAIAYDMAEKVRSNRGQSAGYQAAAATGTPIGANAATGPYSTLVSSSITNCASVVCTSTQLMTYDIAIWDRQLLGASETVGTARAGGIVNARGCIVANNTGSRVIVTWTSLTDVAQPANYEGGAGALDTCANAGAATATTVAARRVVWVDVF
jgi:type IV pilus assembly protein PilV